MQDLPEAEFQLAEAHRCWQDDRFAEGLDLLQGLPDHPQVRLTRGLLLLCLGQELQAEWEIRSALPSLKEAELHKAHYDLGVSYEFRNQLEAAHKYYQLAADGWRGVSVQHPALVASLFGLAGVQQKLKRPQIRATCNEFIQLVSAEDERWPAMAEALALDYLEHRQWAELEAVLQQLWGRSGRATIAYFLGITASHLDRPAEAHQWLARAEQGFQGEERPDLARRAQDNLAKLRIGQQSS
ncbi:hypothetical protein JST97_06335 [bacterium]|nr:hypothetical protein [bacterium]